MAISAQPSIPLWIACAEQDWSVFSFRSAIPVSEAFSPISLSTLLGSSIDPVGHVADFSPLFFSPLSKVHPHFFVPPYFPSLLLSN